MNPAQQETIEPREEQPCWCPDSFLDADFHVSYCPQHGVRPDPDSWDYRVAPYGVRTP